MFELVLWFKDSYKQEKGSGFWKEFYRIMQDYDVLGVGDGGDFAISFGKDSEEEQVIKELGKVDYIESYEIEH